MPAPITVRRLRAEDLDHILMIEHASFGEDAYDRNLFAEFLDKCGDLFLVAERERRVCGYMIACIRGAARNGIRTAELVSVAIDPRSRKFGGASALMDSTLRRLRRRGVDRLSLMVRLDNEPARAFYGKYGFRRVRIVRRYYGDGGDALLMSLQLRPEC
jgi:ribosomal-protein-alanine N-acetyltransferase